VLSLLVVESEDRRGRDDILSRILGPLMESLDGGIASGLLVVGLLRCLVTIDDHAAARGWIAGTIAAIRPGRTARRGYSLFVPSCLPAICPARPSTDHSALAVRPTA
jgi:hypothetical protein